MAKDFISEIESSYMIPSQIMIGSGSDPVDVRDWCDSIGDFDSIADNGMEIRYEGLSTYERYTGRYLVCRKNGEEWEWIEMVDMPTFNNTIAALTARIVALENASGDGGGSTSAIVGTFKSGERTCGNA